MKIITTTTNVLSCFGSALVLSACSSSAPSTAVAPASAAEARELESPVRYGDGDSCSDNQARNGRVEILPDTTGNGVLIGANPQEPVGGGGQWCCTSEDIVVFDLISNNGDTEMQYLQVGENGECLTMDPLPSPQRVDPTGGEGTLNFCTSVVSDSGKVTQTVWEDPIVLVNKSSCHGGGE